MRVTSRWAFQDPFGSRAKNGLNQPNVESLGQSVRDFVMTGNTLLLRTSLTPSTGAQRLPPYTHSVRSDAPVNVSLPPLECLRGRTGGYVTK